MMKMTSENIDFDNLYTMTGKDNDDDHDILDHEIDFEKISPSDLMDE